MRIFHVPAEIDEAKELVSVKLPPNTAGGPPEVAYLMSLTLEGATRVQDAGPLGPRALPSEDIPPVTTHAFDPAEPNGADGWYAGPVGISLDATDEQAARRRAGPVPVTTARSGPTLGQIDFDDDGEHTLEYRAIDCAGNAEEFKSVDFKVDAHAPSTTARLEPGDRRSAPTAGTTARSPSTLDGARRRMALALAAAQYRVDGGAWTAVRRRRSSSGDAGMHTVRVPLDRRRRATSSRARSLPLKIDATAPVTTALVNGAAPVAGYAGGARVTFVRSDGDGSGAVVDGIPRRAAAAGRRTPARST